MSKLKMLLKGENFVHFGYAGMFLLFALNIVFEMHPNCRVFTQDLLTVVLIAIACFLLGSGLLYLFYKIPQKTRNVLRIAIALVLAILHFYLFFNTAYPPGWDVQLIYNMEITDSLKYFVQSPNNLFVAVVLDVWSNVTSGLGFASVAEQAVVLNILFVDATILFLYFSVKKVFSSYQADKAMLFAIPLVWFSPWVSVYYTDTVGMFFPISILFFAIYAITSKNHGMIFAAVAGVLVVVGAYIKVTVLILPVAIIITLVFNKELRKKVNIKNSIHKNIVLFAVLGMVLGYLLVFVMQFPYAQTAKMLNPDVKARSVLYFTETGLKPYGYGMWNDETFNWTIHNIQNPDYEEQAKERILTTVSKYGVAGMAEHLFGKLLFAGSDGTFYYGGEGDFHLEEQASQDSTRGFLQNYVYNESSFYTNYLAQFLQALWLLVCIQSIFTVNNKQTLSFIMKLAVGGLFLFLLLFENRSRYVFLYTPIIIFVLQNNSENFVEKARKKLLNANLNKTK